MSIKLLVILFMVLVMNLVKQPENVIITLKLLVGLGVALMLFKLF